MKVTIELDASLTENEVLIRCPSLDAEVRELQDALRRASFCSRKFACSHDGKEYFIPLADILFFETDAGRVRAHTASGIYFTKLKLYELEEMLSGTFMHISKSAILNAERVYSITKSLSGSSVVEFYGTHKQVYVSRHYYKPLKMKLEEKRNESEK